MKDVTPDPLDPDFGLDPFGQLAQRTLLQWNGMLVDIGYTLVDD